MIRRRNIVKAGKKYRIRVDPNMERLDPNDPFLVRKMEEAIKCLTETPLPDWIFKRRLKDLKK